MSVTPKIELNQFTPMEEILRLWSFAHFKDSLTYGLTNFDMSSTDLVAIQLRILPLISRGHICVDTNYKVRFTNMLLFQFADIRLSNR